MRQRRRHIFLVLYQYWASRGAKELARSGRRRGGSQRPPSSSIAELSTANGVAAVPHMAQESSRGQYSAWYGIIG
eukprot:1203418-Rhodomonas_salina.2